MPSDVRDPETHVVFLREKATYCFDFSEDPSVTAGAAISNPVIVPDNSKVTFDTPSVTIAVFTQYSKDGKVAGTVESGKGVKVVLTGGVTKGECKAACQVDADDGTKPIVTVVFHLK